MAGGILGRDNLIVSMKCMIARLVGIKMFMSSADVCLHFDVKQYFSLDYRCNLREMLWAIRGWGTRW